MTMLMEPLVSDPDQELDDAHHTHIVWGGPGVSGAALVMEARVNGTPVMALCGYTWVPSRNPEKHPRCSKCDEIFEQIRDGSDNVNNDPEA